MTSSRDGRGRYAWAGRCFPLYSGTSMTRREQALESGFWVKWSRDSGCESTCMLVYRRDGEA